MAARCVRCDERTPVVYDVLLGEPPEVTPVETDYADLAAIKTRWDQVEQDTQNFLKALDETALERVVEYTNTRGQPYGYPLWQLMLHQVNHATQHRSEVAAMLTQFGHSPGWLDLSIYLDMQKRSAGEDQ